MHWLEVCGVGAATSYGYRHGYEPPATPRTSPLEIAVGEACDWVVGGLRGGRDAT